LKALKVSEVAQELRVDRDTVYRLIKSGKLSAFRVGTRSWRIERRDLDDFIARGKREAYRPANYNPRRPRAMNRRGNIDWRGKIKSIGVEPKDKSWVEQIEQKAREGKL
jgi:excisionase family DNA binding protein